MGPVKFKKYFPVLLTVVIGAIVIVVAFLIAMSIPTS